MISRLFVYIYNTWQNFTKRSFAMKCSQCQRDARDNYCKCQDCGATCCVRCAEKQCLVCPNCGGQIRYLS